MINELRLQYPVPALCKILQVSLSGYHRWRKAPISAWQKEEARLEVEIRETYRPERLREDLAINGIEVGVHRVKWFLRKLSQKPPVLL